MSSRTEHTFEITLVGFRFLRPNMPESGGEVSLNVDFDGYERFSTDAVENSTREVRQRGDEAFRMDIVCFTCR